MMHDVVTQVREKPRFSLRFRARDLLSVAIFVVIFIVVQYAIGMLGAVSPVLYLVVVPVTILVNGITFMLFSTRVKHAGMIALFGVILAVFFMFDGLTPLSALLLVVLSILAEVIMWAGRYRSKWTAILAYTVFGVGECAPFIPLWLYKDDYLHGAAWGQLGDAYVSAAEVVFSPASLALVTLATLVAGFLGGLFGSTMLRKHFERAGLA